MSSRKSMNSRRLGKKSKHSPNINSIDRISDLPDHILHKILSYLPTKTAFLTTALSTRWKSVFPFWVPPITLDLDDSLLLNPRDDTNSCSFCDFVDKVLIFCVSNLPGVEIVKLHCDNSHASGIISWIYGFLLLNVKDLTFEIRRNNSSFTTNVLFRCLYGCKTLKRLELRKCLGDARVTVPEQGFTLPNLNVLLLSECTFDLSLSNSDIDYPLFDHGNKSMFGRLIHGCPALEELYLTGCTLKVVGLVSPVLKKLTIKDNRMHERCRFFDLDVPNLKVLVYDDYGIPKNTYLSDFNSLLTTHINVGHPVAGIPDDFYDEVNFLVKVCSSTAHLYLTTSTIYALQYSSRKLPVFQNLTCLELGCLSKTKGWEFLAHLLYSAPTLEKLTFKEGFDEHAGGGFLSFEALLKTTPICLESHLKEIKFMVFIEGASEFKLIEYFLKHGEVLQKLELHCMPCNDSHTLGKLRNLPRHSKIDLQSSMHVL